MTGIELIAEERQEQLSKHNRTKEHDAQYTNYELLMGATTALTACADEWPENWDKAIRDKILSKSRIDQLKIAGALIAAEIDRLQNNEICQEQI